MKGNLQNGRKYLQRRDWQGFNFQNIQTVHKPQQQKKRTQSKDGHKTAVDISPKNKYRWPLGTQKDAQYH